MTTERDILNQIEYARVTGREEGRLEGMEKGMEIGLRQKAVETARALLDLGVAEDIIVKSTGLSPEEVEELTK